MRFKNPVLFGLYSTNNKMTNTQPLISFGKWPWFMLPIYQIMDSASLPHRDTFSYNIITYL